MIKPGLPTAKARAGTVPFRPTVRMPGAMLTFALLVGSAIPVSAQMSGPSSAKTIEAPFLAENHRAMTRMMDGMAIKPSGNVDTDFAAMMIPHHRGAIEMAEAELRHGHNEALRRIAQEIVVEQQQEIAAMRLALGQPLPPSTASPTRPDDMLIPLSAPR